MAGVEAVTVPPVHVAVTVPTFLYWPSVATPDPLQVIDWTCGRRLVDAENRYATIVATEMLPSVTLPAVLVSLIASR